MFEVSWTDLSSETVGERRAREDLQPRRPSIQRAHPPTGQSDTHTKRKNSLLPKFGARKKSVHSCPRAHKPEICQELQPSTVVTSSSIEETWTSNDASAYTQADESSEVVFSEWAGRPGTADSMTTFATDFIPVIYPLGPTAVAPRIEKTMMAPSGVSSSDISPRSFSKSCPTPSRFGGSVNSSTLLIDRRHSVVEATYPMPWKPPESWNCIEDLEFNQDPPPYLPNFT